MEKGAWKATVHRIAKLDTSEATGHTCIQIGKEEAKMSLYADDMTLYIENPNDCTQNPLELINSAK